MSQPHCTGLPQRGASGSTVNAGHTEHSVHLLPLASFRQHSLRAQSTAASLVFTFKNLKFAKRKRKEKAVLINA